ncbi:MAG TPA: hypothetical protein VNB23_11120 [Ramlibacter sp.]|nr:hypothetical protein [Ramlibacter sp.]
MNKLLSLLAATFLGLASPVFAQAMPGTAYVTEGGAGRLEVQPDGAFALESTGANGHTCNIEGKIVRGRALLEDGCELTFERRGEALHVARSGPRPEACRQYCGARAGFDGDYFREPAQCRNPAVKAQRAAFLADYKARRFAAATARFEKLLGECGRFRWWMDEAEVRNDLALAQHRAGRTAECRTTLKPLERLLSGEVTFPPLEQEWANGVLPGIRFNLGLCGGTPPPARR